MQLFFIATPHIFLPFIPNLSLEKMQILQPTGLLSSYSFSQISKTATLARLILRLRPGEVALRHNEQRDCQAHVTP